MRKKLFQGLHPEDWEVKEYMPHWHTIVRWAVTTVVVLYVIRYTRNTGGIVASLYPQPTQTTPQGTA